MAHNLWRWLFRVCEFEMSEMMKCVHRCTLWKAHQGLFQWHRCTTVFNHLPFANQLSKQSAAEVSLLNAQCKKALKNMLAVKSSSTFPSFVLWLALRDCVCFRTAHDAVLLGADGLYHGAAASSPAGLVTVPAATLEPR